MDPEPLNRTIPATPEAIGPLRGEVQRYAEQAGVADPFVVALALSETLNNAVMHAYADKPAPGDIVITAEVRPDDGLEVIVVDRGRGMVPRGDSPGIGLGLPLIAQLAERFEVRARPGGGTQVCMVFGRDEG